MHILRSLRAARALAATLATALALAACGGSDGAASPDPTSPDPNVPSAPGHFIAIGTSAGTVSLDWATPAGDSRYVLQRQRGDGGYDDMANVAAGPGHMMDAGLAAETDYNYRLVAAEAPATSLAEASATTTDETPPTTAVGAAQGDAVSQTLGTDGGSLASSDGVVTLQVPASALPAGAQGSVQTVDNTAPDGVGTALRVRLTATPTAPLTLRVRYTADQDAQADMFRLAVQRPDGSWLSVPVTAVDRTARTLQAELPPEVMPLLSPETATATASATANASARTMTPTTEVGLTIVDFTIVKYLGFKLKPAEARVAVGEGLTLVPVARVRGYDIKISTCETLDPGIEACVIQPVLETREIPLLNTKAGYDRRWYVFANEGGDAIFGTIAAQGSIGARYTAPAEVPDPDTVLAGLRSVNTQTGRSVMITSAITIVDDVWVGTLSATDGPSDAGTTIHAEALVVWHRDRASETGTTRVYRPTGDLHTWVTDNACQITVDPPTQSVSDDPRLVVLEIDDSVSPPAYHLRLITFWNVNLHGACPDGSTTTPALAGWGWDVQGQVAGDDTRIEGQGQQEQAQIAWSFTRP